MCHSDCLPPSTVAVLHERLESDPTELCTLPCEVHQCVPQIFLLASAQPLMGRKLRTTVPVT